MARIGFPVVSDGSFGLRCSKFAVHPCLKLFGALFHVFTFPILNYALGLSELVTVCPAALPAEFIRRHSAIFQLD